MLQASSSKTVGPLLLLDRERSILEFNRRVLAQARRGDVPLLERLRSIITVSSNLDEFFELRYADVLEAARSRLGTVSMADLQRLATETHALEPRVAPVAQVGHQALVASCSLPFRLHRMSHGRITEALKAAAGTRLCDRSTRATSSASKWHGHFAPARPAPATP